MNAVETEMVGGLIVQVVPDDSPSSPRENDNLTAIYGQHRRFTVGDGTPPATHEAALNRGGWPLLALYLRMVEGAVVANRIGMIDHSGVAFYVVANDKRDGRNAMDPGGWDSGTVGYAYIGRERIEVCGEPDDADAALASEVKEYSDWANGDVYGYTVTRPCADPHHADDSPETIAECPHSDVLDSCWGYIGDPAYALTEGRSMARSISDGEPWPGYTPEAQAYEIATRQTAEARSATRESVARMIGGAS